MNSKCPVCQTEIPEPQMNMLRGGISQIKCSCSRCGVFYLDEHLSMVLNDMLDADIQRRAVLSHWIRTKYESVAKEPPNEQSYREDVVLDEQLVDSIIKNPRPSLPEQADNFIRWIGDNAKIGGRYVDVDQFAIVAVVGSATFEEFLLMFEYLTKERMIIDVPGVVRGRDGIWAKVTLSFPGWERYRELKLATPDTRKAFMAMEYGHPELDSLFKDVLKPAVEQTGFDLFILAERPKAGLLDDRLRVEIQTSRFLIADLTHENAGAYWEAGYAEGLGRPVIYTCEKEKFETTKTHFDTNHHLTVRWDAGKPGDVAEELKATIRATLPAEAKLIDD